MTATLQIMDDWIRNGNRENICLANAYGLVEARRNPALRESYEQAGLLVADGVPVVWAAHWFGGRRVGRVYGPKLLQAACERSAQTGWSHYFYGGAPGVAPLLIKKLSLQFPTLNIAGWASPPFRKLTELETQSAIRDINSSRANILWVGTGAPRQEIWMSRHRNEITVPVIAGVGAAFDFLSGLKPEAPNWMQQAGLGWLFRLLTEPRRLWRRYIFGNAEFALLLAKQMAFEKKRIYEE
jgi:N-acetylglucosaminyldiphosphoundecaprenol N-acetyl-beta-D-mannosaminyltransferase